MEDEFDQQNQKNGNYELGNSENTNPQFYTSYSKKVVKSNTNLRHISPQISPRGVQIINYQDSKAARKSFLRNSTLKNLESGNLKPTLTVKIHSLLPSSTKSKAASVNSSVIHSSAQISKAGEGGYGGQKVLGTANTQDNRNLFVNGELSEKVAQRLEEHKKVLDEGKCTGKEALLAILHEKELENQVKILENRIIRLQVEENHLKKKIEETSNKTEKILESKLRHQEKLVKKEELKEINQQQILQLKGEVNNQREVIKVSLKQKTEQVLKKRTEVAANVKNIVKEAKKQKNENELIILEKNQNLIQKMREDDKILKVQRNDKENEKRQQTNEKYKIKINTHQEKTDQLQNKLRELEEKEQVLVEKLKNTYSLHQAKFEEFQKAFKTKVDSKTPIDINSIKYNDLNHNEYQERQENDLYQSDEQ